MRAISPRSLECKYDNSKDLDLFLDVAEVLRVGGKWLCGKCMVMHALSRGCKHDNEVVLFAINSGDVEYFIVGIQKPCQVVVDTNPRHPAGLAGSNRCFAQSGSVARISRQLGPIAFTSALHLAGG
ncbi:hypothetical protein R6Q59_016410 [Mikania micrantha]